MGFIFVEDKVVQKNGFHELFDAQGYTWAEAGNSIDLLAMALTYSIGPAKAKTVWGMAPDISCV